MIVSSLDEWRSQVAVTVADAASILGISRNRAYESVKCGELPSIKFGSKILVPTAALKRLIGEEAS